MGLEQVRKLGVASPNFRIHGYLPEDELNTSDSIVMEVANVFGKSTTGYFRKLLATAKFALFSGTFATHFGPPVAC